jgi:hypothetical protein
VAQRRHPSIRFRSPPRLPGTTQGLPPQSREGPVVPSIGRDYRTGREEHPVKRRCRPWPGYASRSWACQGIPKSEDKICRFAACSAEAACRASRYATPAPRDAASFEEGPGKQAYRRTPGPDSILTRCPSDPERGEDFRSSPCAGSKAREGRGSWRECGGPTPYI